MQWVPSNLSAGRPSGRRANEAVGLILCLQHPCHRLASTLIAILSTLPLEASVSTNLPNPLQNPSLEPRSYRPSPPTPPLRQLNIYLPLSTLAHMYPSSRADPLPPPPTSNDHHQACPHQLLDPPPPTPARTLAQSISPAPSLVDSYPLLLPRRAASEARPLRRGKGRNGLPLEEEEGEVRMGARGGCIVLLRLSYGGPEEVESVY
jgi:hypothetical protein